MSGACTGQPLSWLSLERYHLGELPADERQRIETHVGSCEACRGILDSIQTDERALRPLPEASPRELPSFGILKWVTAAAAAATAAVIAVVVLTADPVGHDRELPARRIATKGGELALGLIRDRQGVTQEEPKKFLAGDRFKLLLTCPPGERLHWDLVVFQDGETSFPLTPSGSMACANRVPLPGAFRLAGIGPADVCVATSTTPLDRASLASPDRPLPAGTVCTRLGPVPRRR